MVLLGGSFNDFLNRVTVHQLGFSCIRIDAVLDRYPLKIDSERKKTIRRYRREFHWLWVDLPQYIIYEWDHF